MANISRKTNETDINAKINLYGSGICKISTKIGFFDHMLQSFAKHALIDLELACDGDIYVDFHHSVEDVGIVIGSLLKQEIYPASGIERFGDSVVVMDEAAVSCAIDLSNRAFLVYENFSQSGKVGEFDVELVEEFFRAVASNANITLHLSKIRGKNAHHIIEATFKAFAVALRRAIAKNERVLTPSTKGVL
ncbi:imidazoleglycerol-phosphate dehydratase HisB [Campylobacter mucosalis]|uniref:imidazoleglycerol-phosphate dehydratase HisB n=1 Tax=Campylobacter mucosalis TaxID=202 RepID=UPI0004D447C2|nr:imidazoleglycerol-phosphate dehydratase HisB [Campylobacter mucosalis]KEA46241.1 imidazoleglycerol-phosphate dehydratase [Campylobacter mucosalis]QKF62700.1 imidazoleglycerol-phosphate dehydratase [Campylobacter mucosalis]